MTDPLPTEWFERLGDRLQERHMVRSELRCPAVRVRCRHVLRHTCFTNRAPFTMADVYRKQWKNRR